MLKLNATRLVDVWLWECHYRPGSKCYQLGKQLIDGGIPVVYHEPFSFEAQVHLTLGPVGASRMRSKKNSSGTVLRRSVSGEVTISSVVDGVARTRVWPRTGGGTGSG